MSVLSKALDENTEGLWSVLLKPTVKFKKNPQIAGSYHETNVVLFTGAHQKLYLHVYIVKRSSPVCSFFLAHSNKITGNKRLFVLICIKMPHSLSNSELAKLFNSILQQHQLAKLNLQKIVTLG